MTASAKNTVSMSTVMRDISDALSLDRSDRKEDAYRKYLECVLRITTKLLKDLHSEGGHTVFNKDVSRFVKLGQQCMDRVASIATEQTGRGPKSLDIGPTSSSVRVQSPLTPSTGTITTPSSVTDVTGTKSQSRKKLLSPMEMAVKHNQQLLAAYKARQAGRNKSLSASQNLALTIQRKMAENLAIAKAREDALAKKMRERQKRLEEQAARRFHTPVGMSEEEQQQRQIYTKILEFEQEEIWLIDLRKQLESSPDDVLLIFNLIEKVLSCEYHPLTQQLRLYQEKTVKQIYPLVQDKTDQINLVTVPLSKCLLSNLMKFHEDRLNTKSKNKVKLKEVRQRDDIVIDHSSIKDNQDQNDKENRVSMDINKDIPDESLNEGEVDDETQDTVTNIYLIKERDKEYIKKECNKEIKDGKKMVWGDFKEAMKENTGDCLAEDDKDQKEMKRDVFENETSVVFDDTNDTEISEQTSVKDDDGSIIMQISETEIITEAITNTDEATFEAKSKKDQLLPSQEDDVVDIHTDVRQITENVKQNLETAIVKGEKLRNKLERETVGRKSFVRGISLEYDKYNEENMDDLFDDEEDFDDETEETDSALGSSFYTTVSRSLSQGSNKVTHFGKSENVTDIPSAKDMFKDRISVEAILEEKSRSETDFKCNEESESNTNTDCVREGNANRIRKKSSFQALEGAVKQLRNEAYHRHLKNIIEDILISIEKIQVLFVIGFEQLDTAEGRDQCNVLVEKYFFQPIWKYLLMLFRLANEPKEIAIAHIMTVKQESKPAEFSVREKLCLSASSTSESGDYPYKAAVMELCGVVEKPTMLDKLDCLVKTSRLVLLCVDQYYEQRNKDSSEKPSIGADDLLPVLCYIVARCKIPQIVSECQAMERFIHEGYMYGEEGYCLTSFQTAVNYLISEGMKAATIDSS